MFFVWRRGARGFVDQSSWSYKIIIYVCFLENNFQKIIFKFFFCVCLLLKKLVNKKHFSVKENLAWFSGKCFPEKFGHKSLPGSCEKFRNIILFDDYIKFGT